MADIERDLKRESNFVDDRHNLYVGWVLGIALKNGLLVEPVIDDDNNYTDRLAIRNLDHEGFIVTLVVPPPPDDWQP